MADEAWLGERGARGLCRQLPSSSDEAPIESPNRPGFGGGHNSTRHMNVDHSKGWQQPPHTLRLAGSEPVTKRQTLPRE